MVACIKAASFLSIARSFFNKVLKGFEWHKRTRIFECWFTKFCRIWTPPQGFWNTSLTWLWTSWSHNMKRRDDFAKSSRLPSFNARCRFSTYFQECNCEIFYVTFPYVRTSKLEVKFPNNCGCSKLTKVICLVVERKCNIMEAKNTVLKVNFILGSLNSCV